jgi:hypothetical protein
MTGSVYILLPLISDVGYSDRIVKISTSRKILTGRVSGSGGGGG